MSAGVGRPGVVTAIGWVFIAVAALMVLSAVGGLVAHTAMMHGMGREAPPIMSGREPFLLRYFRVLCAVQIVYATFLAIAAVQFLALRAWARCALEVAAWLGLVYVIGSGIFWVFNWVKMTPSAGARDTFTIFGAVMGSVVTVVFAVPCVVLIWLLRGATVRQAMLPRKAG